MNATFNKKISIVLLKEISFRAGNHRFLIGIQGLSGTIVGINANSFFQENHENCFLCREISQTKYSAYTLVSIYCQPMVFIVLHLIFPRVCSIYCLYILRKP